jgi:hypothetical protein
MTPLDAMRALRCGPVADLLMFALLGFGVVFLWAFLCVVAVVYEQVDESEE